jgi:hypothetical protein
MSHQFALMDLPTGAVLWQVLCAGIKSPKLPVSETYTCPDAHYGGGTAQVWVYDASGMSIYQSANLQPIYSDYKYLFSVQEERLYAENPPPQPVNTRQVLADIAVGVAVGLALLYLGSRRGMKLWT